MVMVPVDQVDINFYKFYLILKIYGEVFLNSRYFVVIQKKLYIYMKIILICATGRSGSTTLQRIVNTIKDSNITGENSGAINKLLECYLNIKITNKIRIKEYNEGSTQRKPSWYNCYEFENVKKHIKKTILSILTNDSNPKRVIGFKEIRYFKNTNLINAFIELFPNTKVICHIHNNIDKQCKSAWWKSDENSKEHLIEYSNQLINYSKNKQNCYLSKMDDLFDVNEMKKIFKFLDEELDVDKYQNILKDSLEAHKNRL